MGSVYVIEFLYKSKWCRLRDFLNLGP